MADDELIGLFPTPFLRAPGVLSRALAERLAVQFGAAADRANNASQHLVHTRMLKPADDPLLAEAVACIGPKLVAFGEALLGERLDWIVKELWVNVLDGGGRQAMHNHANAFASGVVYLTPTDPSACTVFMKSPGGHDFVFRNDHAGTTPGEYNATQWVSPQPEPGDLVLFPSYLLHAVPPNAGGRRITLAFNAVPARLESWGYVVRLSG